MKKITLAMVLILMFSFGYATARSMEHPVMPLNGGASDISKLIGKTVKNFQDDNLGTISEFVKGPEGQIAFAMLSYRATDSTRKMIAVPIGALSCGDEYCVLNASRETVGTTPPFVSKQGLAQTRTAANIYSYFGVAPYWTGEENPGGK